MILKPNQREQILPLPVVLITTVSSQGIRNAAPWSNFTPILRPLEEVILASWIKRDTLENIRRTGEFVANIPPVGMEDAIMICARSYPPEVDEFLEAGLEPHPPTKVKSPGIGGCLAWAECVLEEELVREKFVLIIGKVVRGFSGLPAGRCPCMYDTPRNVPPKSPRPRTGAQSRTGNLR